MKETTGLENEDEALVLAPETTGAETSPSDDMPTEEAPAPTHRERIRMRELPECRTGNRKIFRMSDGTEQAVFYPEAVHVFNQEDAAKEARQGHPAHRSCENAGRIPRAGPACFCGCKGRNRLHLRRGRRRSQGKHYCPEEGADLSVCFPPCMRKRNTGGRP